MKLFVNLKHPQPIVIREETVQFPSGSKRKVNVLACSNCGTEYNRVKAKKDLGKGFCSGMCLRAWERKKINLEKFGIMP